MPIFIDNVYRNLVKETYMALNARKIPSSGGRKMQAPVLEPGAYPARLVQIISLGLQKQEPWKGEEKAPRHEIYTTYELLDEFMLDEEGKILEDKPRWISETIPLHSLDADLAKSTKRYMAIDPDLKYDGDWSMLASSPCTVVLAKKVSKAKGHEYNAITGVNTMRAKEAAKAPDLVNPPKVFDVDEPDMEIFWSLPEWLQDKIKSNLEYGGSVLEKLVEAGPAKDGGEDEEKPKARQRRAEKVSEPIDEEEEEDEDW